MFLFYTLSMNKLLETAYKELKKLEQSPVTWETYEKISDLFTAIQCLEKEVKINSSGELPELIADIKENFGNERTIEILSGVLMDFKKDLECVSPHLAVCLVNKIKESIK